MANVDAIHYPRKGQILFCKTNYFDSSKKSSETYIIKMFDFLIDDKRKGNISIFPLSTKLLIVSYFIILIFLLKKYNTHFAHSRIVRKEYLLIEELFPLQLPNGTTRNENEHNFLI
jgi:hypothetical protein